MSFWSVHTVIQRYIVFVSLADFQIARKMMSRLSLVAGKQDSKTQNYTTVSYLIVDADDGATKSDTATSDSPHHFLLARVVGEQASIVVQYEPAVLPACKKLSLFEKCY